eukprot:Hpha_TRINITY_DN15254_c3_g1::TRINITY_DN15254_c3_g1_i1::g.65824::m.65824
MGVQDQWDERYCLSGESPSSSSQCGARTGDSPSHACVSVCDAAEHYSWLRRILHGSPGVRFHQWSPHKVSRPRTATPLVPTRTLNCLADGEVAYPAALPARKRSVAQSASGSGMAAIRRPCSAPAGRRPSSLRPASGSSSRAPSEANLRTGTFARTATFTGQGPAATPRSAMLRSPRKTVVESAHVSRAACPGSESPSLDVSRQGSGISAAAEPQPPQEDECSHLERDIVAGISAARVNPQAFADEMQQQYLIAPPFVKRPIVLAEAEKLRDDLTLKLHDAVEMVTNAAANDERELRDLKATWAAEDAERDPPKKGQKKKPAGKKAKGVDLAAEEEKEAEATRKRLEARAEAEAELERSQAARRESGVKLRNKLQDELERCTAGCLRFYETLAALRAQKPQAPLRHARGLCLAARARCVELAASKEPPAAPPKKDAQDLHEPTRFGMRLGGCTESVVLGSGKGPRAVVYDMLIDAEAPAKHNRAAMFHPDMRAAGCGWQAHPTRGVSCAVLYAGAWEDSLQVVRRRKLPLELTRHFLSAHPEVPRYAIGFLGNTGVEAVEPRTHPVNCDDVSILRMKVPTDVQISAVFATHLAPPASSPLVFIQHAATRGEQELLVRGPSAGIQTMTVHARRGDSAFEYIGPIQFQCSGPALNERHLGFPETSGAFMRRCLRIRQPLYSPLMASELQSFEIVTPAVQFNARAVTSLRQRGADLEAERGAVLKQLKDLRSQKDSVAETVAVALQELADERATVNAALAEILQPSGRPRSAGKKRKEEQQELIDEYNQRLKEIAEAEREQNEVLTSQGSDEQRVEEQERAIRSKMRVVQRELQQLLNEQEKGPGLVELVCGGARHVLTTEGERRTLRGVTLQGTRASLLVDGECVAVWRVTGDRKLP